MRQATCDQHRDYTAGCVGCRCRATTGTDVDAAVVWMVCAGDRAPRQLDLATRLEVIRVCAGRGEPDVLIADRLRLAPRTVEQVRVAHHIPAGHATTERRAAA